MAEIGVGIIGLGMMGEIHLEMLKTIPGARVVGIFDASVERLREVATKWKVPEFGSFDEMLASPDVDVVDVCLPTHLHHDFAIKVMDQGKDVISEKPLARTLDHAMSMKRKSEESGRKLMVGHVVRYFPIYAQAREAVLAGRIGRPTGATLQRLNDPVPPGWFYNYDLSGGVLLDLVIHDFDYLNWVFGMPTAVETNTNPAKDPDGFRHAIATLHFDGFTAEVEGSWLEDSMTRSMAIEGDAGRLIYDSEAGEKLILERDGAQEELPFEDVGDPYGAELADFVGWMRGLHDGPLVTVDDGIEALRVSLAALESCAKGERVRIG